MLYYVRQKSGTVRVMDVEKLADAIDSDTKEFIYTDADGEEYTYTITYKPDSKTWSVLQSKETYVYDRYAGPSKAHWLGTDTNGMDMLTRLMYGGRVSLLIGFIVIIIETVIGVIFGGISGYIGGAVDTIMMRIVEIVNGIPYLIVVILLMMVLPKGIFTMVVAYGITGCMKNCPNGPSLRWDGALHSRADEALIRALVDEGGGRPSP